MVVTHVLFLIVGILIGTRIGLRGLAMFCFSVGLLWALISIPTYLYKKVATPFYDFISPGASDTYALIALFVMVLIGAIQIGWQMARSEKLALMPEGVDHAFGGAVGGALGWIFVELLF